MGLVVEKLGSVEFGDSAFSRAISSDLDMVNHFWQVDFGGSSVWGRTSDVKGGSEMAMGLIWR